MFDRQLRNFIDPTLHKIACKIPLSANKLTILGLIPAFLAFLLIMESYFTLALIAILINRLIDGLDGMVARLTTPTKRGGFLDITCDFLFYGLVPLAFALNDFDNAMASCLLLFAFYINGAAFLANAALADHDGKKAFSYMVGLTEGGETIAFFILFCLFPQHYTILAVVFAGLCLVSAVFRIKRGANP